MDVDTEPSKSPTPHEVVWYSDGNVVLATDTYLFKVHKSLLSLHSSVFKDMFEPLNIDGSNEEGIWSGAAQEMYEGLPVVTLVGDKGEDVVHLLRSVFEPRYHKFYTESTPLDTVVALLLLSSKYDFKDIRTNTILQISRQFPIHLYDYDAVDDGNKPIFGVFRRNCPFDLLNAALKADADVLLPTLYFACANYAMGLLLEESHAVSMRQDCVENLLRGREELDKAVTLFVMSIPERVRAGIQSNECTLTTSCLEQYRYVDLTDLIEVGVDLGDMRGDYVVDTYLPLACPKCRLYVENEIQKRREEIWSKVPSFFECLEWTVIQDHLDAMGAS
ncbi:hypothetical protein SCHPADRAFT_994961 [Schizopora paradoxa]|uniref:BTB domain-containing protein n=1 Tax=Schizopora paradoxa TaxID=27342 RepID=A0A0H2SHX3_9AGAM|nr:hypothetical protein SCHPADRAFT_994961 [Schizopora paradoxa]